LRAIEEEDAPMLQEMINDPEMESMVVGYSYPVSLSDQKKWIASLSSDNVIRYAIEADNKFVGVASLTNLDMKNRTANMNIKLMNTAQGKGYAIRAQKLLISYCFGELNLNCLTANILDYNANSQRLFEKLGFKPDDISTLPQKRKEKWSPERNSKLFRLDLQ
jgi:RimJ/RimL family protein N-acetyltransferase